MAGLTRGARPRDRGARARLVALVVGAGLVAAIALTAASPTLAAEPTAPPAPRPPTCAERFPDEGPGGVDLRLGCIVSELVGLYTPGQAAAPPAMSTYAVGVLALVAALVVAAAASSRLLARRAGRALAPATPDAWWQCPACRSVNGAGVTRCYSCGSARPVDAAVRLETDDRPGTPQSFGRGKHG